MQESLFQHWLLARGLNPSTVRSRISNCRRVESFEGDLDRHYTDDALDGLLARFVPRAPRHRIPIGGDRYNGTATLRRAIILYRDFRGGSGGSPAAPASIRRSSVAPPAAALSAAVRQDDIARITALIESGADVNGAAPGTGYTPLMWARSAVATRTLIHAGANVRARDQQGHTPLMWVISKNNVTDQAARIAKELIDAGADVNARDDNGMTPLDWARFHRNRLRVPRLRNMAERLVSILESATEPQRRLKT